LFHVVTLSCLVESLFFLCIVLSVDSCLFRCFHLLFYKVPSRASPRFFRFENKVFPFFYLGPVAIFSPPAFAPPPPWTCQAVFFFLRRLHTHKPPNPNKESRYFFFNFGAVVSPFFFFILPVANEWTFFPPPTFGPSYCMSSDRAPIQPRPLPPRGCFVCAWRRQPW